MKRSANVIWKGSLKTGSGTVSTESQALKKAPYSFETRFDTKKGTNPEELIGAAHASCFSMAVTAELEKLKLSADTIETKAEVTLEKNSQGFAITAVHLMLSAQVPGATEEQFVQATDIAKNNCPVSKLLKARITLDRKLANSIVPPLQETG